LTQIKDVSVSIADRGTQPFFAALVGNADDGAGANGYYNYTVTLSKTGGISVSFPDSLVINANIANTKIAAAKEELNIPTVVSATLGYKQITWGSTQVDSISKCSTFVSQQIQKVAGWTKTTMTAEAPSAAVGVTAKISRAAANPFTSFVGGTSTNEAGTNGTFRFVVTLSVTGGTSLSFPGELAINAHFANDQIANAKTQLKTNTSGADTLVADVGYVGIADAAAAKAAVEDIIKSKTGWSTLTSAVTAPLNSNGVLATVTPRTATPYTAAVAGTSSAATGTNGSYLFNVTLTKTNGVTQTLGGTLTINANYANAQISAAKSELNITAINAGEVNAPTVTTAALAKAEVEKLIKAQDGWTTITSSTGALSFGVKADVVDRVGVTAYQGAVDGTLSSPAGVNGFYKFTVNLTKTGGIQQSFNC